MGTQFKYAFDIERNQTRVVIHTDKHPGLYVIRLIENGSLYTTKYIRARNKTKQHTDSGTWKRGQSLKVKNILPLKFKKNMSIFRREKLPTPPLQRRLIQFTLK